MAREPIDWDRFDRVLELVKAALGRTATEIAVNSGMTAKRPHAPRNVANWLNHMNAPEFEPTMELLSSSGLLQPDAEAAWRGISVEEAEQRVAALRSALEARDAAGRLAESERRPRARRRPA
jgi:hypothetical protein